MSLSVSWKRSSSFFGSLAMLASNVRYGEPSAFGIRLRVEQNAQPQAKTHAILQCPCPAQPASYSLVPTRVRRHVCAASFQHRRKTSRRSRACSAPVGALLLVDREWGMLKDG